MIGDRCAGAIICRTRRKRHQRCPSQVAGKDTQSQEFLYVDFCKQKPPPRLLVWHLERKHDCWETACVLLTCVEFNSHVEHWLAARWSKMSASKLHHFLAKVRLGTSPLPSHVVTVLKRRTGFTSFTLGNEPFGQCPSTVSTPFSSRVCSSIALFYDAIQLFNLHTVGNVSVNKYGAII